MKRRIATLLAGLTLLATAAIAADTTTLSTTPTPGHGYFDHSGRDDGLAGGV
jgi:proline iminopeptidase